MIPVLDAESIRAADAYTIAHEPIASIDLMERAAMACTDALMESFPSGAIAVVAGPGNNGGDGLAMARQLRVKGREVTVYLAHFSGKLSDDARVNLDRLQEVGIEAEELPPNGELPILTADVLVDALFGTGLHRPISGRYKEVVYWMNSSRSPVVAVDMPSGLFTEDNATNDSDAIVQARMTCTFECGKLALLLPEFLDHVGQLCVLPIGLDAEFIMRGDPKMGITHQEDLIGLLPPITRSAHKGNNGHGLLIAGSKDMIGAAVLAARSAVRTGLGLLSVRVPSSGRPVLQSTVPVAMTHSDPDEHVISELPDLRAFTAIAIGPGLGQDEQTARVLKLLLQEARVPLVLDADALNILAANHTWLAFLPPNCVLTPHPGELDRLTSTSSSGYERLQKARELAAKCNAHVVLKGPYTAVCSPSGQVRFNPTGNAGMAKGGSGDVLTGMLLGLLARGMPVEHAALVGVWLHGRAGDLAAEELGMEAMNAADLERFVHLAFNELRSY